MAICVMLACLVAPLFAGVCWRRATREGATSSIILGLIGVSIASYYARYVAPFPMHPSIYCFVVSISAIVIVGILTKKPDERVLDETMTGMYLEPRPSGMPAQKVPKEIVMEMPAVKR
jgi:sodium/proline symporter